MKTNNNSIEEEYFAKEQAKMKAKIAKEEAAKKAAKEAEDLKKLHWMRCPKCGNELEPVTTPIKKFQVDRCKVCHGIWFDSGEVEILSKVLEGPKNAAEKVMALFRSGKSVDQARKEVTDAKSKKQKKSSK